MTSPKTIDVKTKKTPKGRPKGYTEAALRKKFKTIAGWAKNKCSDREIAERLGISEVTFSTYKNKRAELRELLTEARKPFVSIAEGSLLKLVEGFYYEEQSQLMDKAGNITMTTVTKRFSPPQSRAIELFLSRYDPKCRKNMVEDRDYAINKRKLELLEIEQKNKVKMERLAFLKG